MELYKILTAKRKSKGMSVDDLAAASNIPKSTLSKILAGITKSPEFETVRAIADALDMSLEDLSQRNNLYSVEALGVASDYDGLDRPGKKAVRAVLDVEMERVNTQKHEKPRSVTYIRLPFFDMPAAGGIPEWFDISNSEMVDFDADVVPSGASFSVRLSGDSMEPDYPDGCTVFVRRTIDITDGDVVIVWLLGKGMVCKRAVFKNERLIRLKSINRAHEDYSGAALEDMKVYGKVIGMTKD